ncbi:unnamed protein product [Alopecurus aequalis]
MDAELCYKRPDGNLCQIKQDDMLSDLPDYVLLTILDRLNVRDAARTSVLSRRWRQLPSMLSRLVIDVSDFLDLSKDINEEIVRGNAAVMQVTKNMLTRRESSRNTIHLLSIAFVLREDDPMIIGNIVGHTMATHKIELAEFAVLTEWDNCDDDDLVDYGRKFMLFFDTCPNAFGGLTRVYLENLRFGDSDISNILNTCKRLKHLHLFKCDSGSGRRLRVEHPQLSELIIDDCSFEGLDLNLVPKLTRIVFEGWLSLQDPISFGNVPLLKVVSLTNVCLRLHNMVKLSKFLWGISMRDLNLGFASEKIWVQPERLTKRLAFVFHQLRFLYLVNIPEGYDLSWTFFIIKAAPNLKDLYLSVWDHLCAMETDPGKRRAQSYSEKKGAHWELPASNFQHHSLATLVIFGFRRGYYMASYVKCVLESAVNLEEVFLYGRLWCSKCRKIDTPELSERASQSTSTVWKDYVDKFITNGINTSAIVHLMTGGAFSDDRFAKLNSL